MTMRLVIVGFCLLATANAWSNKQLLNALASTCSAEKYICPQKQFGKFDGFDWFWDEQAVINAPAASVFRNSRRLNLETANALKDAYCCLDGPCLARCGIFPLIEIDLVKSFPGNANKIFNLGIPELEKHRIFVLQYAKNANGSKSPRRRPAELEEFFDDVFEHQEKIRQKMHN